MLAYVTMNETQAYFETRLHTEAWDSSDFEQRQKALYDATRRIDRLNFAGEKAAAYQYRQTLSCPNAPSDSEIKAINTAGLTQELAFPRGTDSEIPQAIKDACCEIAYALLDGRDPDKDLEDLATVSQGFSSIRNTKDRSFAHEHLLAGIPSAYAWSLIRPFLRDPRQIKLVRVS